MFAFRVKLRELGGCRVLVSILESEHNNLKHRVVNSLLQFMYDNHSLNVLMSAGLIPSLINFVDEANVRIENEKICHQNSDKETEKSECAPEINVLQV